MKNLIACIAAGAAILIGAPADAAGVFRAYLSSKGNDANPCSVTAPCRLVPAALLAVADGGEIWMLDSANYNTATVIVSKSVTILAIPGAVGSFVSTGGGPAITVPIAGKALTLRNVMVVPLPGGGGGDGVFVGNGAVATLE